MGQNHYIHSSFERLSWWQVEVTINQNSKLTMTIKPISHKTTGCCHYLHCIVPVDQEQLCQYILWAELMLGRSNISSSDSWLAHNLSYLCFKKSQSNSFALRPRELTLEFCKGPCNYPCGIGSLINQSSVNPLHGFWLYNICNMYDNWGYMLRLNNLFNIDLQ